MQRDEEFTAFVEGRSKALHRLAYVMTGDRFDAEDLVQATLVKLYVAWPRIVSTNAVDSYARTVLVRTHFASKRRKKVPLSVLAAETRDRASANALNSVEQRDELWDALLALPPRQRAVIVLKYLEDLDEATIASMLGCSQGTVKSQASKALGTLQRRRLVEAPRNGQVTGGSS